MTFSSFGSTSAIYRRHFVYLYKKITKHILKVSSFKQNAVKLASTPKSLYIIIILVQYVGIMTANKLQEEISTNSKFGPFTPFLKNMLHQYYRQTFTDEFVIIIDQFDLILLTCQTVQCLLVQRNRRCLLQNIYFHNKKKNQV